MAEQSISNELTLDEQIELTDNAIIEIKESIVKSKKMIKLCEIAEFKELILDGLLGEDMVKAATDLVNDTSHGLESEQETLAELRSLRYLKKHIVTTADMLSVYENRLKEEEDFKTALQNSVEV